MRRPLIFVSVILVIVGALAAWEFPNYLRKPSLRTHVFEEEGCRIDLFFDGVRPRKAAVFFRSSGRELLLDVLDSAGVSLTGESFGSLRWTRDRSALVATTAFGDGEIEIDRPLWVFDTVRLVPITKAKDAEIQRRGGLGDPVFSWFDLGRTGRYLFSWDADRWREQVKIRMEAVEGR